MAWTTDLAIDEIVFVLSSKQANNYGYSRQQVSEVLLPLLGLKTSIPHRKDFTHSSLRFTSRKILILLMLIMLR